MIIYTFLLFIFSSSITHRRIFHFNCRSRYLTCPNLWKKINCSDIVMVGNKEETMNLWTHYDCPARGNFNITNDNSALNINVHFHRDASKNNFPEKFNSYPFVHCNKKLQKDESIIQIDSNSQKCMHNDCLKMKLQARQNRKLRALLENFLETLQPWIFPKT